MFLYIRYTSRCTRRKTLNLTAFDRLTRGGGAHGGGAWRGAKRWGQLEAADVSAAKSRVAACDETVDPREAGPLECRLVRAVYAKALAPGIN